MEKKTRFEISTDELNARMEKQKEQRDEPVTKAVRILEAAVDKVLTKLGVNVDLVDSIPAQMDALGIVMTENTEELTPQLNGFFIYTSKYYIMTEPDLIPYAWVGAARIGQDGRCFCDIQYFQDNRLEETGGIKLVG